MTDHKKDIILIGKFVNLELSDAELTGFEKRILNDPEFEEKFETYLEAEMIVHHTFLERKEQLRFQKLRTLLDKKKATPKLNKVLWNWISAVAAGFIILFSIWQLNSPSKKTDTVLLLKNAWEKNIGLNHTSVRTTSKDSLKQIIYSAFDAYHTKNYHLVIDKLDNLNPSTTYYEDVLLLRGLSNYKTGNTDIALKTLDSLANYPTEKKSKVARWYQGLIYLEMGNLEAAQKFIKLPDTANQEIKLNE